MLLGAAESVNARLSAHGTSRSFIDTTYPMFPIVPKAASDLAPKRSFLTPPDHDNP